MSRTIALLMVSLGCGGGGGAPAGGGNCQVSRDCDEGYVCIASHCGLAGTVAEGGACTASRDCQDGLFCTFVPNSANPQCQPGGDGMAGDGCASDVECTGGLRCDLYGFSGECAEGGNGERGDACTAGRDCLAGLWCGSSGTCGTFAESFPPWAGVECAPPEGDFRVLYEIPRPGAPPADFFRLPFPNDIRVNADGTLDLSDFPRPGLTPLGVDLVGLYADAWSTDFEGFGSTAAVTFRFSAPISFGTTERPGAIRYLDVTPGASFGQPLALGWTYTTGRTKFNCENVLTIRNDVPTPLRPGHTYAVLLSTEIRSETGAVTPVQDADFAELLGGSRPGDAVLGAAWDKVQPLRDVIGTLSIDPATVAAATVFTVQDTTGLMERVAASVATEPAPVLSDLVLCDQGVTSPCDDGTPQRVCGAADPDFYEIHGRFTVPIYQSGTAPYERPADGGGIVETSGVPVVQRTEAVCFALTIPKATMPAGGWPLVVHHHGTGGSMRGFVNDGIARALATGSTPAAVFGFDAVEHGARRGGSTASPDRLVFNALNPWSARDNFLQGAADILQALRVAGVTSDAIPGVMIAFDATRVAFFGHSQGATSGTLAMAFSDDAPAIVLSGAGSFLTASLQDKTSPIDVGAGLELLLGEPIDGSHPMMTIWQSWFERSDPINYDLYLLRYPPTSVATKHIFMSYGIGDTYSPKSTLDLTALGLATPLAMPVVSAIGDLVPVARPISLNVTAGDAQMRTAAVFQYTPGDYDGHFVASQHASAIADWMAFLTSWLETGTPTVP